MRPWWRKAAMSPQRQHISKARTITYSKPHTSARGRVRSARMPQKMKWNGLQAHIVERWWCVGECVGVKK